MTFCTCYLDPIKSHVISHENSTKRMKRKSEDNRIFCELFVNFNAVNSVSSKNMENNVDGREPLVIIILSLNSLRKFAYT